jgi:hypothetical protein
MVITDEGPLCAAPALASEFILRFTLLRQTHCFQASRCLWVAIIGVLLCRRGKVRSWGQMTVDNAHVSRRRGTKALSWTVGFVWRRRQRYRRAPAWSASIENGILNLIV